MESYDNHSAIIEWILYVSKSKSADEGWPPEELLKDLGADFNHNGFTRVVEFSGRKYCGAVLNSTIRSLDDDMFESLADGRPNQAKKVSLH